MGPINFGSDYDATLTKPGEHSIAPELVPILEEVSGSRLQLMIVTGRFPGQLKVLGGEPMNRILDANSRLNREDVHVYAGGAVISDAEENIYSHREHILHTDQIKAVEDLTMELIDDGFKPYIVFQSAEFNIKSPTQWVNGQMHMIYSHEAQITENIANMYPQRTKMLERGELERFINKHNPSKLIVVSGAFNSATGPTISDIAETLAKSQLGITGNHQNGIDITKGNITKVSGIQMAMRLLGINQLDYYAGDSFGPHGNDMPVFQYDVAKKGVVVSHVDGNIDMSFSKIPFDIVDGQRGLADYIERIVGGMES